MSTPGGDTSIVEICRSKIAAALETEDVKVTGVSMVMNVTFVESSQLELFEYLKILLF